MYIQAFKRVSIVLVAGVFIQLLLLGIPAYMTIMVYSLQVSVFTYMFPGFKSESERDREFTKKKLLGSLVIMLFTMVLFSIGIKLLNAAFNFDYTLFNWGFFKEHLAKRITIALGQSLLFLSVVFNLFDYKGLKEWLTIPTVSILYPIFILSSDYLMATYSGGLQFSEELVAYYVILFFNMLFFTLIYSIGHNLYLVIFAHILIGYPTNFLFDINNKVHITSYVLMSCILLFAILWKIFIAPRLRISEIKIK